MSNLLLDLRYALRSLRRTPGIFAVAVITIALGVGANTAMFSVVNGVVLTPLPYPEPERVVAVWPEKRWSVDMLEDVRAQVRSFEALSAVRGAGFTLFGEGVPELVDVAGVSAQYFDVVRVRPALGRAFEPGDATAAEGHVALLSHDFWRRRFGADPTVVGRTIRLAGDGVAERTVIGVMPRGFVDVEGEVAAWVPLITSPDGPGYWGTYGMRVVGRLAPGATAASAGAEMRSLIPELSPEHPTQFRQVRFSPVDVVPLLETLVRDVRGTLLVLLGAVAVVLLIACTNVANLLLARSAARQREVGLQMALGSPRGRIVRQVLTESALLGLAGGAVGLGAAYIALPLIRTWVAEQLPRSGFIEMDPRVLGFALGVSLLAGLIFGAWPALRAAGQSPAAVLREGSRGQSLGRRAGRANDLLVVTELALSLVLVAGAGLMLKSFWQLNRVDAGFDASNVLTLRFYEPPGRYDSLPAREALFRALVERVEALPGIERVGATNLLPLGGGALGIPYRIEGQEPPEGAGYQVVSFRAVTPEYFGALRIPLRRGRMLAPEDAARDDAAMLVNEAFARQHWPDTDALGQRVLSSQGEPMGTVVGVVADVRQAGLGQPPEPEVYVAAWQAGWGAPVLAVRGSGGVPSPTVIQEALRSVEPDLTIVEVRSMEEVVRGAVGDARFYTRLFGGFALLALVLGLVGVYGVMSYAMSRRTQEMGVRMALGATAGTVLATAMRRAMAPVAVGVGVGLVGAVVATRVLRGLLYEVSAADPWVLAAVALLLTGVGAAGALVPALRAMRLSPLLALRRD